MTRKEYSKEYYKRNKDKLKKYSKLYRKSHQESVFESNKTYRKENPDKVHKCSNLWKQHHPKQSWAISSLNRHRQNGCVLQITPKELYNFVLYKDICNVCEVKLDWTVGTKNRKVKSNSPTLDRINNSTNISLSTIQILCYSCNRTKSNRTMDEFIQYCQSVVDKFVDRKIRK